ncbi:MAG: anaerobic carbon-monoxide dehydrogenase catalytic subunit [Nitrospirae bacterium]|uniref:anaerobic carbon-monoxide dehydrogenase catalytic subunit n=1 Tax=Candidatus Magnetobacterium casense TaxID=1455061 RepID=UPI00058B030A|nr:anaerobic carbon-monoxide dehydrogenase catalytic subunit [Candidatus Magnetobacterium casensis]MBF0336785.1 anaerobic carbon-monoxide dehydrogenase catalytic subunit [Nitrospirota bacterium]
MNTLKNVKSADAVAEDIIQWAHSHGMKSAFDRAEDLKPCPIGHSGACCKICFMGPCRLVGPNADEDARGVCGASLPVVAARNFLRMCAAGTAAHSDHARDMAFTLLEAATGEAKDFEIKDEKKLKKVAGILGIETEGKNKNEIGKEVALAIIANFGQQKGEVSYVRRATKKRQEVWKKWGITPRGIDREVAEAMHRTNMGVDQDPENLLMAALKVSLADGWGGSMFSTDITDILFGTPMPKLSTASLGVMKEDEVTVVLHGHEPTLAEMIVDVSSEPEILAYAATKGAKGINLVGMCCTANEVLMRHGIPTAGGFLNQELAVMTGLAEAMVVDVQCIMPAIADVAKKFHTKIITTSHKGKMVDATHIQYDEHRAKDIARQILRLACDNFPNRTTKGQRSSKSSPVIAGFSHEYIEYMQGGSFRGSFRPLNDAIMAGRIRGVAGIVGCNNPRTSQDSFHDYLATEFIRNDVLVVSTGCGAAACAKAGYMTPEHAFEMAGVGLREVCVAIGIPPILHLGSCVDNSRILTIATHMCEEGGLGDDIFDLPAIGIAPEWMSEKALAIGAYCVASGMHTIFGSENPMGASETVVKLLTDFWEKRVGGKLEFIPDPKDILERALSAIDSKRDALKLKKYEPGKFGAERVLMTMADRRKLEKEQQQAS